MTYAELAEYLKPYREKVNAFSKETLLGVLFSETYLRALQFPTQEMLQTEIDKAMAGLLGRLKNEEKSARFRNRVKRLDSLIAIHDRMEIRGADCNACEHWRERRAKKRGTRIPGGVGKCTRPEGHCRPSKVRETTCGD